MKKKGFTLVELLVVIAIIALLMGILMPALSKVRQMANRIVCGTNLSGIGKAMMIYAEDNDGMYPLAGGEYNATWVSKLGDPFDEDLVEDAFTSNNNVAQATIGSCFYLLVKYAGASPAQFICKGDDAKEMDLGNLNTDVTDLTRLHDFHPTEPGKHYSYSYNHPFEGNGPGRAYPVTNESSAGRPVCADRNPWYDINSKDYIDGAEENHVDYTIQTPEDAWSDDDGYDDPDNVWNAAPHQREGQNVLYNDGHVEFQGQANAGIDNDNIWFEWDEARPDTNKKKQLGMKPNYGNDGLTASQDVGPWDEKDAFLVNESNKY